MNGKKLSRILQAIGLVGLGYEAIKTYRAHKKSCLEQERREREAQQQMIINSGLSSKEEFTQILSEEDPIIAMMGTGIELCSIVEYWRAVYAVNLLFCVSTYAVKEETEESVIGDKVNLTN